MLGGTKAQEEMTDGRCIMRRYSISCTLAPQLLLSLCCGIVQCREDTVLAQARGFSKFAMFDFIYKSVCVLGLGDDFVICVVLVSTICAKRWSNPNLNPEPMKSHQTSNGRRQLRLVAICSSFSLSLSSPPGSIAACDVTIAFSSYLYFCFLGGGGVFGALQDGFTAMLLAICQSSFRISIGFNIYFSEIFIHKDLIHFISTILKINSTIYLHIFRSSMWLSM